MFSLGSFWLISWVCPPHQVLLPFDGIGILGVPFDFVFLAFLFIRGFTQKCLECKRVAKTRGCPSGFWYPISMFH
jgi:hypothetical protein